MDEFLKLLSKIQNEILSGDKKLDDKYISQLQESGHSLFDIEQVLLMIYNLCANREMPSPEEQGQNGFRYFSLEEEALLGEELCSKLRHLQISKLLSPMEVDFLVQGYVESKSVFSQDSLDFWEVLKAYKKDLYEYVKLSESGEQKGVLVH